MQKLLRATATSPSLLLSPSTWLKTKKCSLTPNPNRNFSFSMPVSFNLNSPNPPFRRYAVSTPRNLITCSCGASSQNRARTPPLRRSATWRGFRDAEGLRNENKVGVLDGINHEEKKREENHRSESEDENDEGFNEKSLEPESSSNVGSSKVVYRRQKGAVVANVDLLVIPGVGPRNLRKLVGKGFAGVAQLKQLYRDKFFGKSSVRMVEFLRSSVGIVHKDHAESITSFIEESVDEELKEDSTSDLKPTQKKRLTFCVEGNISVGKTTFLQRIANETLELRDLVEIVPEPINKWQDIGPEHFNILDAFYAEPQRYAYTFQNYVFVTRVMQERDSADGIKPLRLMERSVFRDRMVFVRAVHEAKWMNEMEISIYNSWFDPVVSTLPGLILDGFIYLKSEPRHLL